MTESIPKLEAPSIGFDIFSSGNPPELNACIGGLMGY